jgi:hypothetical protein
MVRWVENTARMREMKDPWIYFDYIFRRIYVVLYIIPVAST